MREHKKSARSLIYIGLAVLASAISCPAQAGFGKGASDGKVLFVLASNIEAPVQNSDPVPTVLYSVSPAKGLVSKAVVLQGSSISGAQNWLPDGVFSINEVGRYLIVEYPHDVPCCVIFISEDDPAAFESVRVVPDGMTGLNCGLSSVVSDESEPCNLWELTPFAAPELLVQGKVSSILQSVCKRPGQPPYTVSNRWEDFTHFRFDGVSPISAQCYLWSQDGTIHEYLLGRPPVVITKMPADAPLSAISRRLTLDTASRRFRVISIDDSDLVDHNTDVFVQTVADGRWKRLPVLPVRFIGTDPTKMDRMAYRLFDDWLVTSASAALLKANDATETAVPDVLTVVETGKQRDDLGVEVEPRTAPDVATLPARRITLWNLADGRRIDLAMPEDDSEIVHVFDGHSVLLRIHDKLFFAEIQGSKLTDYKLVAFDSAIPQVHWAFYSGNDGHGT
jgi:hypothetical protein